MSARITVAGLYDTLHEKLALEWVAGRNGGDRELRPPAHNKPAAALAGHLNFIHDNRLQVLGSTEFNFLNRLSKQALDDALQQMFSETSAAVLIAEGKPVGDTMKQLADATATPLFRSPLQSHELLHTLQYYLTNLLAQKTTLHGVFMEVMGLGVLITGASGVGKSELALELLSRGHRLIADDAPEFARIAPDLIVGTCPAALREFLEVRGLGLLNIRAMFGDSAVKQSKYLRLIVNLEPMTDERLQEFDRLRGSRANREVLGMPVPEITLPVAPGRNLAVLVEAAARNHSLTMKGYDASQDFISQQQRLIENDET